MSPSTVVMDQSVKNERDTAKLAAKNTGAWRRSGDWVRMSRYQSEKGMKKQAITWKSRCQLSADSGRDTPGMIQMSMAHIAHSSSSDAPKKRKLRSYLVRMSMRMKSRPVAKRKAIVIWNPRLIILISPARAGCFGSHASVQE